MTNETGFQASLSLDKLCPEGQVVSLFTSISVNSLAMVQSFELLKSKPLKVNQGSLAAYC